MTLHKDTTDTCKHVRQRMDYHRGMGTGVPLAYRILCEDCGKVIHDTTKTSAGEKP